MSKHIVEITEIKVASFRVFTDGDETDAAIEAVRMYRQRLEEGQPIYGTVTVEDEIHVFTNDDWDNPFVVKPSQHLMMKEVIKDD